jgi:hypothetical protein
MTLSSPPAVTGAVTDWSADHTAIELDGSLPAGQYTVMAEILVHGHAMNPEIERIPVVIGGKP